MGPKAARRFDLVVVAGDLLDSGATEKIAPDEQVELAGEFLCSLQAPAVFATGNHDLYTSQLSLIEFCRHRRDDTNLVALDGESVELEPGLTLAALGWNEPCDWPVDVQILVTHAPPSGCAVAQEEPHDRDMGDFDLLWALRKCEPEVPKLILSGHVHEPKLPLSLWPSDNPRAATTILVPGFDLNAAEPNRWEIDLRLKRATWCGDARRMSFKLTGF